MQGVLDAAQVQAALALIDASFAVARERHGYAGFAAAVVLDQEMIWARGYGYADSERGMPSTPQTLYSIASITKLFTVTMLLQLRDAGKLQLDDPVTAYDPSFTVRTPFPTTRPITFRQLASHTAGLPKDFPFPYWETQVIPPIDQLLATLPQLEPAFPPMTRFKYSNVGMACLGHALERVAGQPYAEYVMEHITLPLGMTQSGFELTESMAENLARGYEAATSGETPRPAPYFPNHDIGGLVYTGGLYASVEDIARFISLQFRDGPPGGTQILDGATLREMRAPVMLRDGWQHGLSAIGLGWWLGQVDGELSISHAGDHSGFAANITLLPERKLGVALFMNTNGDPGALATETLETLLPAIRRIEAEAPAAEVPSTWQRCVGDYGSLEVCLIDGKLVGRTWDAPNESITYEPLAGRESEPVFRMRGGFLTGDVVTFEEDASGRVSRIRFNGFSLERTSP